MFKSFSVPMMDTDSSMERLALAGEVSLWLPSITSAVI